MAKRHTADQLDFDQSADLLKARIKQETSVEAEKRVNPYREHPLSACALLRAILCEIWELRQDIAAK